MVFDACEIGLDKMKMSLMDFFSPIDPIDPICVRNRGGVFDPKESSTWNASGTYPLSLDPQLGFGGNGQYGFDTVALGDQVAITSRVVGVVNVTQYWLGFFGLGTIPVSLGQTQRATVLSAMVELGLVPSHSYGYTAGAYHRERRRGSSSSRILLT